MSAPTPRPQYSTALSAGRRARALTRLGDRPEVDVLVIGGGVTGAGIALDAAARGLRTVLVERHDLAHGTSRWSSKLAHGGLRYLASGQFAIAHESALERHLMMTTIAPHLTRPLAQVLPLYAPGHRARGAYIGLGYGLGDALRRVVRTPGSVLAAPGRLSAEHTRALVPAVRAEGLRGGLRGWDGQLFDDARLVVALARTAAGFGADILTQVEATRVTGDGATLIDRVTGERLDVRAGGVLSATGVWAAEVDPALRLRPSRGTHLVVSTSRLGGADAALTVPIDGSRSRFVFTVPAPHGRTYIGLTDVPADGPVPEVPRADDTEIRFLLDTVNRVLERPLAPDDILGTFAGLRPLLAGGGEDDETSDLSRRHAVLESDSGVLSIVGGKLTTYRRMAEDGVDALTGRLGILPPSPTARLPLVGAWPRARAQAIQAPPRLVRRYGAEAPAVAALPAGPSAACGVTAQELQWAIRVEGAMTIGDVLDRRTRLGLVAADAEASADAAAAAFAAVGVAAVPDPTGSTPSA